MKRMWLDTIYKDATKKRMERTIVWPNANPEQSALKTTMYPIMNSKGRVTHGTGKRDLIRRRFGV